MTLVLIPPAASLAGCFEHPNKAQDLKNLLTSIHRLAPYFTSLCGWCLRQNRQYLFRSMRSGSFFLFFIVE
jgi:hypothetical protein